MTTDSTIQQFRLAVEAIDDPEMWVFVWSGDLNRMPPMLYCIAKRTKHRFSDVQGTEQLTGSIINMGMLFVRRDAFGPLDLALLSKSSPFKMFPMMRLNRLAGILRNAVFLGSCAEHGICNDATRSFNSFLAYMRKEIDNAEIIQGQGLAD